MESTDISSELALAKKAAEASGKLLQNKKKQFNEILSSNSKDIKLKADTESEELIKEIITSQSAYPILSEESGKSSENLGDIFWVVDPLDGTANYNRDIPFCCVSIGLVNNMKPVLGAIYDFNNDQMYFGDTINNLSKNKNDWFCCFGGVLCCLWKGRKISRKWYILMGYNCWRSYC